MADGRQLWWAAGELVQPCRAIAAETGAKLMLTASVEEGVSGVDFIHLLEPYPVSGAVMAQTGRL